MYMYLHTYTANTCSTMISHTQNVAGLSEEGRGGGGGGGQGRVMHMHYMYIQVTSMHVQCAHPHVHACVRPQCTLSHVE